MILDRFNIILLKINLKIYYFNIFLNKKYFKKLYYDNHNMMPFLFLHFKSIFEKKFKFFLYFKLIFFNGFRLF